MNISEHLSRLAAECPEHPVLLAEKGKLTAAQLEEASNQCACGLSRMGIRKGTRTVVMVQPGSDFLILTFALFKVGAVLVLVDPGMGRRKLANCLREANPQAFAGSHVAHAARLLLGWCRESLQYRISLGRLPLWGGTTLRRLLRAGKESPPESMPACHDDETAAIVFTSGSTGIPKGVLYTHRMFATQAALLQKEYSIQRGEVDLATFPLFALYDPALGMTTVFPRMDFTRPGRVEPERIFEAIRRHHVTHMFGSPALLDRVGRKGVAEGIQLPSLRRVLSAGAPVSDRILDRFSRLIPDDAEIYTPYGATEALPVCSISARERRRLQGYSQGKGVCVGRPVDGVTLEVIRLTDQAIPWWSDDLRVAFGEIGELVVSGANVSKAYLERPESNRLAKIRTAGEEVKHRMGDAGYFDEEGRVWFCGRKAHRVVTEDGTLFPVPCEGIFNQHPAVFRTALVGIGEPPFQEPVLCVELEDRKNWRGSDRLGNEILELGSRNPQAARIKTALFHRGFPVDPRHNAKIFREKLARWAEEQLT